VRQIRTVRDALYAGLRVSNDVRAVRRRRVPRRIARRAYGRITGHLARRIFG